MITVRFKKFSDLARTPEYANPGDSGADLFIANLGGLLSPLYPGQTHVFWTDVGIELPPGFEAQIRPRSSLSKKGLHVHLGTVDSGYRGNCGITITNIGMDPHVFSVGDKVAQLVIAPVQRVSFELAEELSSTERGHGAYGSSDAKREAGNSG